MTIYEKLTFVENTLWVSKIYLLWWMEEVYFVLLAITQVNPLLSQENFIIIPNILVSARYLNLRFLWIICLMSVENHKMESYLWTFEYELIRKIIQLEQVCKLGWSRNCKQKTLTRARLGALTGCIRVNVDGNVWKVLPFSVFSKCNYPTTLQVPVKNRNSTSTVLEQFL
jgi:hypothetical protein